MNVINTVFQVLQQEDEACTHTQVIGFSCNPVIIFTPSKKANPQKTPFERYHLFSLVVMCQPWWNYHNTLDILFPRWTHSSCFNAISNLTSVSLCPRLIGFPVKTISLHMLDTELQGITGGHRVLQLLPDQFTSSYGVVKKKKKGEPHCSALWRCCCKACSS